MIKHQKQKSFPFRVDDERRKKEQRADRRIHRAICRKLIFLLLQHFQTKEVVQQSSIWNSKKAIDKGACYDSQCLLASPWFASALLHPSISVCACISLLTKMKNFLLHLAEISFTHQLPRNFSFPIKVHKHLLECSIFRNDGISFN